MGLYRIPTRAVRTLPASCAFLAALLVLLGLLLAAPAQTDASELALRAVHTTTSVLSHRETIGAGGCHASAACAVGLVPTTVALRSASASASPTGWPPTSLDLPSRLFAPDPPPPRP